MTRRRVLVTGAGGFVGRALSAGFADLGWEVTALDRAFDAGLEDPRVERVVADLEVDGIPSEVPVPDLLVHGAWVTTEPEALDITAAEYVAMNLRALLAALEFASRGPVPSLVFLSSSGVFAADDGGTGLTDVDHPTGASPYALAKRAGELLVSAASGDTAVHVVRLGYLFGPGETPRPGRVGVSLVARWLAAAREGRALEVRQDDPVRDWTYTPDLAHALARLVDGPTAGRPVHLGSGQAMRDSEVAAVVASGFPDSGLVEVPAAEPMKPPMVPSDLAALRDLTWTEVSAGVDALVGEGVGA